MQPLGRVPDLGSAGDLQFFQNMADMGLDGGQLDVQSLADLGVALPGAEQLQHLALCLGKRGLHLLRRGEELGGNKRPASGLCAPPAPEKTGRRPRWYVPAGAAPPRRTD